MSALRAIREKKGFSLSQLASRAGISTRVLAEYEDGVISIPLPHARLLAKALWIQIEELMPPAGSAPVQTFRPHSMADAPRTNGPTPPVERRPEIQQQPPRPTPPIEREAPPRPPRPKNERPSSPPPLLSEGQLQELSHLASRLDVSREQLEERIGKPLDTLNRLEAKDWMKRLRLMADELAPNSRARYGRWPATQEDREATYLAQQVSSGALFTFKLFNGETICGLISDYTPYTITITPQDKSGEVVVRKLALAYYRKQNGEASSDVENNGLAQPRPHDHDLDDSHQPLDEGIDSDRVDQPDIPERNHIDEDRGL